MLMLPPRPRLVILGLPGAGKSTLARALSRRLQIPHIEADCYFWDKRGNAVQTPLFVAQIREQLTRDDAWIFEGHFNRAKEQVSPLADAVIWLDLPYALVLRRWLTRSIRTRDFGDWRWVLLRRAKLNESYLRTYEEFKSRGALAYRITDQRDLEN